MRSFPARMPAFPTLPNSPNPWQPLKILLIIGFAEMKTAIAEGGMSGDQRLHLAACMDKLVDLQAKTQARLDWFDTLGSDLAEMVDRG